MPPHTVTRRRWVGVGVVAALAVVVAVAAYLRFWRAVAVDTVAVTAGSVPAQVIGPGTVQARVPVTLSARVTSTVTAVEVDVGDAVRAGQSLVTLDDRDLAARRAAVASQQASLARQIEAARAAVAKAQADLDLARTRQQRDADLQRQGFVSAAVLDASNAAVRAAQAALDGAQAALDARLADQATLAHEARLAETQLGYTRLVAPMDGVVVQRLVEPGATVAPGAPILRLVDPASLWVATRVDESVVARVQLGQPAMVRLRSGEVLSGRVARIALQSDAATRELDVFVAFERRPARLAVDQEAEVRIDVGRDEGLVVPLGALTRDRSGRQGVLQVVDGRTRFVPVTTGAVHDGRVLVRRGLAAGDVVVARAQGVVANQRVRVAAP
ncbi:efflux RND transporter periplasmic adaptor subunit [Azohydromonas sediminis]|uniref:efflux RND transporter periplasmic adaptor subunit n=1 Tax=Azohydromonas sediminis TaxID=2259674 RepID=UPI000E652B26|nr:efflux RND transporter periplasmic adaptor subunit [Azohydromonas sediminis]